MTMDDRVALILGKILLESLAKDQAIEGAKAELDKQAKELLELKTKLQLEQQPAA